MLGPIGRLWNTAAARLGLRGVAMLVLAAGWYLIGFSVLIDAAPAPRGAFHGLLPIPIAVGLWWVTATVAAALAWTRTKDHIGIGGLVIMPILRALSFGGSWVVTLLPPKVIEALPGDRVEGSSSSWIGMAYSLLLLAFVAVVASIHDVPPVDLLVEDADEDADA